MLHRVSLLLLGTAIATLAACNSSDDSVVAPEQTTFGPEGRQTKLRVPESYDHAEATPLLVVLHGFGATGLIQLGFSQLGDVDALILAPDGTINSEGVRFWNATDACCNFDGSAVDDVGYLSALIDEVREVYNVDARRIYLWGHSNGGFMAYRMACERSGDIAAIISLAGATYLESSDCNPSEPVSVLQVHGDLDTTILFDGGSDCVGFDCLYPGAVQSVSHWANYDGCDDTRSTGPAIDLDSILVGSETLVERHDGCPAGVDAELWRIAGGVHIPSLAASAGESFWTWLQAHPKP